MGNQLELVFRIEDSKRPYPHSLKPVLEAARHNSDSVQDRPTEVKGRGIGIVSRGAADFTQSETEMEGLDQNLVVENEIVGVVGQG